MSKVKIKVTRQKSGNVYRSLILIDDRLLPFTNTDAINILAEAGRHGITVICIGDTGASVTATVTNAAGALIPPLTTTINPLDNGIDHASDEFAA